ncbi:unnamed protein product [Peniophora sp. CBMAI 1063]|nr:unnamed protein product [Peniophora sp. CBMAI 1063]
MPRESIKNEVNEAFLLHQMLRNTLLPPDELSLPELILKLENEKILFEAIQRTRVWNPRVSEPVPKGGTIHLAFEYAKNPEDYSRFIQMLRISPYAFWVLVDLIKKNPVFHNGSNHPQAPVEYQLAVTLFRLGRFGNGASLDDIAREAGVCTGTVHAYTERCFKAILSLHDMFVRPLTEEEKEREKRWIDEQMGFKGAWRDGWVMYDGTIVVLYQRPGWDGDAYYTRKCNSGMNLQVGNVGSNLRIVDYSHGHTGSAHDASAFKGTCAYLHPDWFFKQNEFAWVDSAYPLSSRTIPVHKQPAADERQNRIFDQAVSHLRVRSEHCMGALKGRFQCLRGLRANINSPQDHIQACRWMTVCIILHNLIIDVDGDVGHGFDGVHGPTKEREDFEVGGGLQREPEVEEEFTDDEEAGEAKRIKLTAELLEWRILSRGLNID